MLRHYLALAGEPGPRTVPLDLDPDAYVTDGSTASIRNRANVFIDIPRYKQQRRSVNAGQLSGSR
jgi:hypothetical protein